MPAYYTTCDSPVGALTLVSDGTHLTHLLLAGGKLASAPRPGWVLDDDAAPFAEAARQLAAYLCGDLTEFRLPLALAGTEFQRRVWRELQGIPYGSTISYAELARRVGNPAAVRAVGLANGRNPVSIIVPCHRVVGSDGRLTGYSGGLERKEWLLALERRVAQARAATGRDG